MQLYAHLSTRAVANVKKMEILGLCNAREVNAYEPTQLQRLAGGQRVEQLLPNKTHPRMDVPVHG